MKNDIFKEEDLLAVVGGSVGKEDKKTDTAVIATVVAVGLHDLIVETQNGIHKVSKEICQKIDFSPGVLKRCKVKIPELGDLVLSYEKKPYSVDPPKKTTGVLYKISYKMGTPDTCVIMCGTDMVETRFSNIVLLQSRQS